MALSLDLVGLSQYLETAKGAAWLRSKEVREEALTRYALQQSMAAWRAASGTWPTPAWLHLRKDPPRTLEDIGYFGMSKAELLGRQVTAVVAVEMMGLVPAKTKGRFDVTFRPTDSLKWLKLRSVPFQAFDPFLQYWAKKGMGEEGAYSLGEETRGDEP